MSGFTLKKTPDALERSRAIGRVVEWLEALAHGRAWRVEIQEQRRKRSNEQNAYYWGAVVKAISDESGYEPDEVHEFLCGSAFGWKDKRVPKTPRNPSGLESVPVRTTTVGPDGKRSVLNKQEFTDYIEFCRRFAIQKMNLLIEDPHYEERAA